MFSSIKNALLDRTNRPRNEPERKDDDKQDSVVVDTLGEQASTGAGVQSLDDATTSGRASVVDDSTDTGLSIGIESFSQHALDGGTWNFLQFGYPRHCFHDI